MLCPGQGRELLSELTSRRLKLKILIKRGKYVSQNKFDFKYLEVSGDCCPYQYNHNHLLPTIQSAKPFYSKRKVEEGKEEKKTRLKMNKTETQRHDIALPPISQMMEVQDDLRLTELNQGRPGEPTSIDPDSMLSLTDSREASYYREYYNSDWVLFNIKQNNPSNSNW